MKTLIRFLYPRCGEVIIVFMLAPPLIITLLLSQTHQHSSLTTNKAACGLLPLQKHLVKVFYALYN